MTQVFRVDAIESRYAPHDWAFATERAADIDAHWRGLVAQKPLLYDGRVLLIDRHDIDERDGRRILATRHFATDYRAFLAWRDFGFPDAAVKNCFAAAALRSRDGAFLLGEMASHTANAGKIYCPAGTPDMGDVNGDTVDLAGSVLRELEEETGIAPHDVVCDDGWSVVLEGPRIGCMKIVRCDADADAIVARIHAFLARDANAELARMHVVRGEADLMPDAMPGFVVAWLRATFAAQPPG